MKPLAKNIDLETLNVQLNDPEQREAYKQPYDNYKPGILPSLLVQLLVLCSNVLHGREPSYLKFRAVEIIARVPYHAWSSATFTLLTLCFTDEQVALRLSKTSQYAGIASDNETMHVVVISQLAKHEERVSPIRHTLIPMLFAFFYFWSSYWLYLIRPRWSLELNFLFESHAFAQYDKFLQTRGDELRQKPLVSDFLNWYGRHQTNQYDFFQSVRNDELIHRNQSLQEIDERSDQQRLRLLAVACLLITITVSGFVIVLWLR